jgi:hypothetical protein
MELWLNGPVGRSISKRRRDIVTAQMTNCSQYELQLAYFLIFDSRCNLSMCQALKYFLFGWWATTLFGNALTTRAGLLRVKRMTI